MVPLFLILQNKALVKMHKKNRLFTLGSGGRTAWFIVKMSQRISNLDFIVANYPQQVYVPMPIPRS